MINYRLATSFEELPTSTSNIYFVDTETIGLYGTLRLLQLYNTDWECPIIIDTHGDIENASKVVVQAQEWAKDKVLVFYNAAYDLTILDLNSKNFLPKNFEDLFLLVKLNALGIGGHKLDEVCQYYSIQSYEGLDKKKLQKSDFTGELSDEQYQYAATDVLVLPEVYQKVKHSLTNSAYTLNKYSMLYALSYCKNGIPVDVEAVKQVKEQLIVQRDELQLQLEGLNVNSPKQCKEALGTDSSNMETLTKLKAEGNELADKIYTQRRIMKRIALLESYEFPRVYTRFNVAGAVSGRFTASGQHLEAGINSQQIPRDLKYLFKSTDKNKCVIEADYSTLELRLAAAMYGDRYMRQQLVKGEDLHTSMAQKLTGKKDVTKEQRTQAKAINFGFVFGMSAKTFVEYAFMNYGVKFTYDEAVDLRNKYFTMYQDLQELHKFVWENYEKPHFYVTTALGWRVKPKLGTDGINIPIQGTGAECTKLAIYNLIKTDKTLINNIVNVVHDSIKLEVETRDSKAIAEILEKCMVDAWKTLCDTPAFKFKDIPMLVDVEVL